MTVPEVSVVIAAFNAAEYLRESLLSITSQHLATIEVIVINDGSTDGTREIAELQARSDNRVRLIDQPNAGAANARNAGIAAAQAPWIAFQDADDVSLPERLGHQLAFLQSNPDVAALGTFGWRIGRSGRELGVFEIGPTSREEFGTMRDSNSLFFLYPSSVMLSKEVALKVGGFRDLRFGTEDLDLWTRLSDDHLILVLPEYLIRYRVHSRSLSASAFVRQQEETLRIVENTNRRRMGQRELEDKEFRDTLSDQPFWERFKRRREWLSRVLYRNAGARLADRNPFGLFFLAGAFAVKPSVVVGRLRTQVVPWVKSR